MTDSYPLKEAIDAVRANMDPGVTKHLDDAAMLRLIDLDIKLALNRKWRGIPPP